MIYTERISCTFEGGSSLFLTHTNSETGYLKKHILNSKKGWLFVRLVLLTDTDYILVIKDRFVYA